MYLTRQQTEAVEMLLGSAIAEVYYQMGGQGGADLLHLELAVKALLDEEMYQLGLTSLTPTGDNTDA